jgi:DNA repair protein RadC
MSGPVLMVRSAAGRYRKATETEVLQAATAIEFGKLPKGPLLQSPGDTRRFLVAALHQRKAEVFCAIFLDNRHRKIAFKELFQGTIDGASVHPREVIRACIELNAAAIILVHNHPSGVCEPSQADELITNRLRDALALADIRVLDHIIVAGPTTLSFAERGLL